jgi:hypothetical protein
MRSTELGALLCISTLFYFSTSSISGPNYGNYCPRFLNHTYNIYISVETMVLFLSVSMSKSSCKPCWLSSLNYSFFFARLVFMRFSDFSALVLFSSFCPSYCLIPNMTCSSLSFRSLSVSYLFWVYVSLLMSCSYYCYSFWIYFFLLDKF